MKKLLDIAKYITAVATIAGAALWMDAKFDGQTEHRDAVLDSIADVKEVVWYNNAQIEMLAERQEAFHDTLIEFEKEHKAQGEQIEVLGWAIENINNLSPEMLEEILSRELKKNEGWSMKPTLYEPDTELIGVK